MSSIINPFKPDMSFEEFKETLELVRNNYQIGQNLRFLKKTQPNMVSFIRKIYLLLGYPKHLYLPSSSQNYPDAKSFKISIYKRYSYLKDNIDNLNKFFKNLKLVKVDGNDRNPDIYYLFSYEECDIALMDYYMFQNNMTTISEKGTIYAKRT